MGGRGWGGGRDGWMEGENDEKQRVEWNLVNPWSPVYVSGLTTFPDK